MKHIAQSKVEQPQVFLFILNWINIFTFSNLFTDADFTGFDPEPKKKVRLIFWFFKIDS